MKTYTVKTLEGVEIQLHAFLTSALDRVSGKLHVPASLSPVKEPCYLSDRNLGG